MAFKALWIFTKKCISKSYSFLVTDATLGSDNILSFWKNLLERIQKLITEINDKISDERLQYDIDREAVERSTLSEKSDNYEYLMDEEILHSNQRQIIKQAKFTYYPLGKAFEKQKKQLKCKEKNRYYYKSKRKTISFRK